MRKPLTILGTLALAGLLITAAGGDTPKANEPDETAIRKSLADYAAALTKGDLVAVALHWTADAEFIDEAGTTHKGRNVIVGLFAKGLEAAKGAKYHIAAKTLRFPAPGVALVEAYVDTTAADGSTDRGPVSSVWVKTDGKWLLTHVRDLPDESPVAVNPKAILDLGWMVGEWASDDKSPVALKVRWVLDKHFLLCEYAVPQADGTAVTVAQMVGYDPASEQLASWTFDSRGGNGAATWTRAGNTWTGDADGVLADGRTGSCKLRIKYLDEKLFQYESAERQIDGQPVADSSVKYVRKAN